MVLPRRYKLLCPVKGCGQDFYNKSGLTKHINTRHANHNILRRSKSPTFTANAPPVPDDSENDNDESDRDALFDDFTDALRDASQPDGDRTEEASDWTPYDDRIQFEMAEFLYKRTQLSQPNVDWLMDAFTAFGYATGTPPPFVNHDKMHSTIDSTTLGDAPWYSFSAQYTGSRPTDREVPKWMNASYDVWCRNPHTIIRNMLANPDFKDEFDPAPYKEFDNDEVRQYSNLMSGDWAWRQADLIAQESPNNHGAMFTPIILGSDKTTVSVATGQNEYYPLYISLGNVTNGVRRAHRNAVAILGFLAIPKGERKDREDKHFRKFRRQLFHSSISTILQPLRPAMTVPEVAKCPDGHFRRVIYGLGPYIADYPEQVLAACVVQGWCPLCPKHRTQLDQPGEALWDDYGVVGDLVPFTNDFPRADIHELLSGDLLHQVIKGTFKDHLVTWVGEYLHLEHGETKGNQILDEIDRRIALAPAFPALRRFHEGRDFKQWTGDDSKALMKVYIPAITGLVPDQMVKTFSSFLEFCYLARRSVLTDKSLKQLDAAITSFHEHRKIFVDTQLIITLATFASSVPRMASAPQSQKRLDKLAAARADFEARGMLIGSLLYGVIQAFELAASEANARAATPADKGQSVSGDVTGPEEEDGEEEAEQGPRVESSVTLARRAGPT
ncbi:hypothetical protein EUX98_g9309 [Antrodiella citrinella]|uniref:C2H2-type domain-containing protein n=1 Tax=Antrodiella citrinella TaxID=2447956 RepID=A0A4S4LVN6_9APHY|nr:hypothetical protein EUX98_g9309 [Antrodiella citrinella]